MAANNSLVARRYAQAAIELAVEHNNMAEWRADMATLAATWAQTRIALLLDDPKLGRTRRMDEARKLLQGHVNPLALNMVLLLVERGRANLVPLIAAAFERIEDERERRVTAHVTAAMALTEAQRADLSAALGRRTGREVELDVTVDPSIIGGFIVRVGDELIDASVAARLRRIEAVVSG